jgi:hypothetical protein
MKVYNEFVRMMSVQDNVPDCVCGFFCPAKLD